MMQVHTPVAGRTEELEIRINVEVEQAIDNTIQQEHRTDRSEMRPRSSCCRCRCLNYSCYPAHFHCPQVSSLGCVLHLCISQDQRWPSQFKFTRALGPKQIKTFVNNAILDLQTCQGQILTGHGTNLTSEIESTSHCSRTPKAPPFPTSGPHLLH